MSIGTLLAAHFDQLPEAEVVRAEHAQKLAELGLDSTFAIELRRSALGFGLYLIDKRKAPATRRRQASRPRSSPVTVSHVRPDIHEQALRLAAGDASRLRIISPRKVEVV